MQRHDERTTTSDENLLYPLRSASNPSQHACCLKAHARLEYRAYGVHVFNPATVAASLVSYLFRYHHYWSRLCNTHHPLFGHKICRMFYRPLACSTLTASCTGSRQGAEFRNRQDRRNNFVHLLREGSIFRQKPLHHNGAGSLRRQDFRVTTDGCFTQLHHQVFFLRTQLVPLEPCAYELKRQRKGHRPSIAPYPTLPHPNPSLPRRA